MSASRYSGSVAADLGQEQRPAVVLRIHRGLTRG